MVRVGPDAYEALVKQPHARRMDFTGRPMKGFVFVASAGLEADAALREWVEHGVRYAASLSAKGPSGKLANAKARRPRKSARPRAGSNRRKSR